jgi:hypothetical protein
VTNERLSINKIIFKVLLNVNLRREFCSKRIKILYLNKHVSLWSDIIAFLVQTKRLYLLIDATNLLGYSWVLKEYSACPRNIHRSWLYSSCTLDDSTPRYWNRWINFPILLFCLSLTYGLRVLPCMRIAIAYFQTCRSFNFSKYKVCICFKTDASSNSSSKSICLTSSLLMTLCDWCSFTKWELHSLSRCCISIVKSWSCKNN